MEKLKLMFPKKRFNNCLFFVLYVIIRGKADKIVIVSGNSKFWPHHYLIQTKKKHLLHFQTTNDYNQFAPYWYEGQIIGIRRGIKYETLANSGRRLIRFCNPSVFGVILLICIMILLCPWIIFWTLYTPVFCLYGIYNALCHRIIKRYQKS